MSALPSTPAMSGPLPLYRPDPNFREPFNADTIFSLLDRFLLSPTTLLVFPLIIAWHSKSVQGTPLVPATEDWFSYTAWRQVIGAANVWRYKVPIIIAAFVLFKTAHRALSRIVQNNGVRLLLGVIIARSLLGSCLLLYSIITVISRTGTRRWFWSLAVRMALGKRSLYCLPNEAKNLLPSSTLPL